MLAVIAWGIIPIAGIRIENEAKNFSYDSWNWFVAACGVPSLLLGFWLFYFPESPKFMMECGDYDEALKVLQDIYTINTGDDRDNYPVRSNLVTLYFPSPFFHHCIPSNFHRAIHGLAV